MPSEPEPLEPRRAVSFRIRPSLLARMRRHIRDHAGRPMYLSLAPFLESAIEREIERTELIASGALPPDPVTHEDPATDPVAGRKATLKTINNQPPAERPAGCSRR
jgi:hypothetical protein